MIQFLISQIYIGWQSNLIKNKTFFHDMITDIQDPEVYPDIEVVKVNVQEDHVRMVAVIPPRIAVVDAIQYIKTHSAKKLKVKFPFMQKAYTGKAVSGRENTVCRV